MRLFGIEIGVGLNSSGFSQGLDNCKRQLSSFGASIGSNFFGKILGPAAALGLLTAYIAKLKQIGAEVKEIKLGSLTTGLDKQTFQIVNNALKASGASAEEFESFLGHVAVRLEEARNGSVEAAKDFANLGVSLDDVRKKSRQQIAFQIFEHLKPFAAGGTITDKQLDALKGIGGRGAVGLVPTIARGFDEAADSLANFSNQQIDAMTKGTKAAKEYTAVLNMLTKGMTLYFTSAVANSAPGMMAIGLVESIRRTIFGNRQEIKPGKAGLKVPELREFRAGAEADKLEDEKRRQGNREAISQLEAEAGAMKDHLLPPAERLRKIQEERFKVQDRLNKIKPSATGEEASDVNRATLQKRIAELNLEAATLDKDKPERRREGHPITALQEIGAQILSPASNQDKSADELREHTSLLKEIVKELAGENKTPLRPGPFE